MLRSPEKADGQGVSQQPEPHQFDLFSELLPPVKPKGQPRTVDFYAV